MSGQFKISDFCIEDKPIPLSVADKLQLYHIDVIQEVRDALGFPIWPSKHSGYRSRKYELSRRRAGTSEHTFHGKGACDYTCFKENLNTLFNALVKSDYTRVCLYPRQGFIHADYKGNKKKVYKCFDGKNWERQK